MKDCLTIFSLRNVLNGPTRVTINSSTLIDPVIVSDACTVLDSGTMDVNEFISEHKSTFIAIQISIKISISYYREVWNYRNADTERLNQIIRSYNRDSIINDNCAIGDACINFTDVFLKFCMECILSKGTYKTK